MRSKRIQRTRRTLRTLRTPRTRRTRKTRKTKRTRRTRKTRRRKTTRRTRRRQLGGFYPMTINTGDVITDITQDGKHILFIHDNTKYKTRTLEESLLDHSRRPLTINVKPVEVVEVLTLEPQEGERGSGSNIKDLDDMFAAGGAAAGKRNSMHEIASLPLSSSSSSPEVGGGMIWPVQASPLAQDRTQGLARGPIQGTAINRNVKRIFYPQNVIRIRDAVYGPIIHYNVGTREVVHKCVNTSFNDLQTLIYDDDGSFKDEPFRLDVQEMPFDDV